MNKISIIIFVFLAIIFTISSIGLFIQNNYFFGTIEAIIALMEWYWALKKIKDKK